MKKIEGYVYENLLDKRERISPKFQVNDLVRFLALTKTISKGDTTIWSHILYKSTEIINETIPIYHFDSLPERCIEALLKKTELTLKENENVMKA